MHVLELCLNDSDTCTSSENEEMAQSIETTVSAGPLFVQIKILYEKVFQFPLQKPRWENKLIIRDLYKENISIDQLFPYRRPLSYQNLTKYIKMYKRCISIDINAKT